VIDESGSYGYACVRVISMTVSVVSKNESNYLLENKIVSTSGDMSDYCMLFSQTFYGFLFSYLTITNVRLYVHNKFPVSFLLYIATKKA